MGRADSLIKKRKKELKLNYRKWHIDRDRERDDRLVKRIAIITR